MASSLAKIWHRWNRASAADNADAYARRMLANSFISIRRRRWGAEYTHAWPEPPALDDQSDLMAVRVGAEAALAHLWKRQRAVVVLRFFDDVSEAQVAEVMGCRIGTVKSTTAKALQHMRAGPGLQGHVEEAAR